MNLDADHQAHPPTTAFRTSSELNKCWSDIYDILEHVLGIRTHPQLIYVNHRARLNRLRISSFTLKSFFNTKDRYDEDALRSIGRTEKSPSSFDVLQKTLDEVRNDISLSLWSKRTPQIIVCSGYQRANLPDPKERYSGFSLTHTDPRFAG